MELFFTLLLFSVCLTLSLFSFNAITIAHELTTCGKLFWLIIYFISMYGLIYSLFLRNEPVYKIFFF